MTTPAPPSPRSVAIITPYYWPEIAASVPLMRMLAEGLVDRGWRVQVLTMAPSGTDVAVTERAERGLEIVRQRNRFARRKGTHNKVLEYLFFSVWVFLRLLFRRGADVFFVSSNPPLIALPVAVVSRLRGVPLVYNLQDLFPESAFAAGLLPRTGTLTRILEGLEAFTYRSVTSVIAISDAFRDHVIRKYPASRTVVIPNWVDLMGMGPLEPGSNALRQALGREHTFLVVYSGNMGLLQNLDALLDAASLLRDRPFIHFLLIGDGNRREHLQARMRAESLSNVTLHDYLPYERLRESFSAGDIGVVPMRAGAGASSVPSKTWNYLACERPVVAVVERDSTLAAMLAESGAGVSVAPDRAQDLVETLIQLQEDEERRQRMGRAGRAYVEAHLGPQKALDRYHEELVHQCTHTVTGHARQAGDR